ncbi:MAG TPA: hypothetical protein VM266_15515 [Solirubrobacteraceae bacterium]|nr:hypothetical protein [Solirubrobacteraceae bacterium]
MFQHYEKRVHVWYRVRNDRAGTTTEAMPLDLTSAFADAIVLDRPVLRISYDADLDFLTALVPGQVIDGQLADEVEALVDERAWLYFRGSDGPLIGFGVAEAFAVEPEAPLWEGPRFHVPSLALRAACAGEILLAARHAISGSTPDVAFFDSAVAAGTQGDWDGADFHWRCCLECGEMRAHYGLGYTLVELGRPQEALGHLMAYTEICPRNAWAWVWRGRAAHAAGDAAEAAACYRRAIACEQEGSYATDAEELLAELEDA